MRMAVFLVGVLFLSSCSSYTTVRSDVPFVAVIVTKVSFPIQSAECKVFKGREKTVASGQYYRKRTRLAATRTCT